PHELAVLDVKAAFCQALKLHPHLSIPNFSTWPKLHEFRVPFRNRRRESVRPDGFFQVIERTSSGPQQHSFFLEVDRSTESQQILTAKATDYRDYYRSGGFARRNGAPRSEFKKFPFRVLLVCVSQERLKNTAESLLSGNPSIRTQVHLSTLDAI